MVWGHEVHNINKRKNMEYKLCLKTKGKRVAMLFLTKEQIESLLLLYEQETDVWDIASPNYCKKRHKT